MDISITHCPDCHTDYKPRERHIWNCVGKKNIDCPKCPANNVQALRDEIGEFIKKKGSISYAEGVFGDYNRNLAYFKDPVHTEDGDAYPIFGCSYLYPNTLLGPVHDSCTATKGAMMAEVEFLLNNWFIFNPFALFFFKRVLGAYVKKFSDIYESDLKQKTYKYLGQFSRAPREFIRAGLKLANKIPLKNAKEEDFRENFQREYEGADNTELRIQIRRLVWCIGTFVQSDSAYKLRLEDALMNLDKGRLRENPRKEILRLFDLVLAHEATIADKVALLRKMASFLLLAPFVRRIACEYFNELDVEQFKPSEADRYFAARIQGYAFEGKSAEERKRWADSIDEIKLHVIITE